MGLWDNLLLWVHFVSLGLGGAASFGMLALGPILAAAQPEARGALVTMRGRLVAAGHLGLGLLILTGFLMIGTRGTGYGIWFAVKMALVFLLAALIVWLALLGRRAGTGDPASIARIKQLSPVGPLLFLGIVLAAVLAFG